MSRSLTVNGGTPHRQLLHLYLNTMSNFLYLIAVVLVIAWVIGFVGMQAGGLIHILLIIAIVSVIFRLIRGRAV